MHIYHSRNSPTHKFIETQLRDIFTRYGRPDEIETDGGPQYQAEEFKKFLRTWGINQRVSSPYYAQSNGRSELAVKSAKRMLRDNINPDGSTNNNKVASAVLQYHNTPLQNSPLSPAQLLFGRRLADFFPANPKAYMIHPYWSEQIQKHQSNRMLHHKKLAARYDQHTRLLKPLQVGQQVAIQDQSGSSKRWSRTGEVIETLANRKYRIRLHDTGNTTIRNRRFLKAMNSNLNQSNGPFSGPITGPRTTATSPALPNASPATCSTQRDERSSEPESAPDAIPEMPPRGEAVVDNHQSSGTLKEKRALKCLRPHNNPGLKEN